MISIKNRSQTDTEVGHGKEKGKSQEVEEKKVN